MKGFAFLKSILPSVPTCSGVYKMIGVDLQGNNAQILYIGKAKNLRDRVSSYTLEGSMSNRIKRMVSSVENLEYEVTNTEVDALILEASLVRLHLPQYNIMLKDDKSNPYLMISQNDEFPRFFSSRLPRNKSGKSSKINFFLFGPFGDKFAMEQITNVTRKLFKLRNCTNFRFKTQKRPCLDYQLGICSAPCVGKISQDDYRASVKEACTFLSGKNLNIKKELKQKMLNFSNDMMFEEASQVKRLLQSLEKTCYTDAVDFNKFSDTDCVVISSTKNEIGIEFFKIRGGLGYGGKVSYVNYDESDDVLLRNTLELFLVDYYLEGREMLKEQLNGFLPREICINVKLDSATICGLQDMLKRLYLADIQVKVGARGDRKKLVDFVLANLEDKLVERMVKVANFCSGFEAMKKMLDIPELKRVEVYDNSHNSGSFCVGAMVVANVSGFDKNEYRKFNIKFDETIRGDDYGMLREVLLRRFTNKEMITKGRMPELVIIDGGLAQYNVSMSVLIELKLENDVMLLCIAKGQKRNAGYERIFYKGMMGFSLMPDDKLLYYLQNLRDEAHRFVITTYRKRSLAENFKQPKGKD